MTTNPPKIKGNLTIATNADSATYGDGSLFVEGTINVDNIIEKTASNGVDIENVLLKDGCITFSTNELFQTTLCSTASTINRNIDFPDKSGVVALVEDLNQDILNLYNENYVSGTKPSSIGINAITLGTSNVNSGDYSIIGGGQANQIYGSGDNSVIAGGNQNTISGINSVISGGYSNDISGSGNSVISGGNNNLISLSSTYSVISGGINNEISASLRSIIVGDSDNSITSSSHSIIIGGNGNVITTSSKYSLIGGGKNNSITGSEYATILNGKNNVITGDYAVILGGSDNSATGNYSIISGRNSSDGGYYGTFVWSDATTTTTSATGNNQFVIEASGGIFLNGGDVNLNNNLLFTGGLATTTLTDTATSSRNINLPDASGTLLIDPLTTKGDLLVHNGTTGVRLPVGSNNQILIADSSTSSGLRWTNNSGGTGVSVITISFDQKNATSQTEYTTLSTFIFPGSSVISPTSIKLITRIENGATSYDVRIQDVSNVNTIASANFSNILDEINDMGTINNIPTAESIFEIQVKRNGGTSQQIFLRSVQIA